MWVTARLIMQKVEERLKVRSFTVSIQEGGTGEAVQMQVVPKMTGVAAKGEGKD